MLKQKTAEAPGTTHSALRIGLMGDSIAAGLGVKSDRYIELVARALGAVLYDFSLSGSTVQGSWSRYEAAGAPHLDVMVIAHGITEPLVRPTPASMRFLPARWRRLGWMDPRPYYSRRLRRRILERMESAARWRIKNILISRYGPFCLMSERSYSESLNTVVKTLGRDGCRVLVLEPTSVDRRYFPGTEEKQEAYYNAALKASPAEHLPTRQTLKQWDDYFEDHFHPNESGHVKLAEIIVKAIQK